MLVNGQWQQAWQPVQKQDEQGRFIRQTSSFRHWITADGSAGPTGEAGFKAEPDRYHLYVAYICPWASRTLMVRALKGLAPFISVSVVDPRLTEQGWSFGDFPGATNDDLNHARYLHQIYTQVEPHYTGRATVPVLWDKQRKTIVNNESADIIRMLNSAFSAYVDSGPDLYPAALAEQIDADNAQLYSNLNNGVYQAGFAQSQTAYEEAYHAVFAQLADIEQRLSDGRPYLLGRQITETDIRCFVTLVRFDAAYYGLFKCNAHLIAQRPILQAYLERIWQLDGIADTVSLAHIKAGYYSVKTLNPSGIVPIGPST